MVINNVSTLPRYFGAFEPNEPGELQRQELLPDIESHRSVKSLLYNFRRFNPASEHLLLDTIQVVYHAFVADVDDDERRQVFSHVIQLIQESVLNPIVLQAFIRFEPNHFLAREAVGAYLQMRFSPHENPFVAAEELVSMIAKDKIINRGAAYAGLVCFGDRRVCSIARTIRDLITPAETRAFAVAVSSPLHRSSIEFCLTWLVELVNRKKFELAIPVASALSAMVIKDSALVVHDCEHNFGPYGFSSSKVAPTVNYNDFLVEIQPILQAINQVEQPALNQLIDIILSPQSGSLDQLERRTDSTRRTHMERRASDRRIVDIRPRSERRGLQQRRGDERRVESRR